jgi:hypothetical protein
VLGFYLTCVLWPRAVMVAVRGGVVVGRSSQWVCCAEMALDMYRRMIVLWMKAPGVARVVVAMGCDVCAGVLGRKV